MPELPEVETVVRDLRPLLTGCGIRSVRHSVHKLRRAWRPEAASRVIGTRIESIRRRGKWIIVDLRGPDGNEPRLIIHLGMTGQLTVVPSESDLADHVHLVFELDSKCDLRFRDIRRFGSADFCANELAVEGFFKERILGPEPFELDPEYFRKAFRSTSRSLKAILLDQTVVAGVGNIYADEACFRAQLHPGKKGKSLKLDECDRLREAVAEVLERAIESRGSTIRDYVGGSGLQGGFQSEFNVYGRTGEPCKTCATAIQCMRLAGRSSHYCKRCQPLRARRQGTIVKMGQPRTRT